MRPLRRTIERTIGISCLALVVGFLLTSQHCADARLTQHLEKTGVSTAATITKKQATSSGQGRDLCYVTYKFQARQASAPNAPVATFSRKVEVPDHFFDSVTEGQTIAVRYDPADPSVSSAEVLIWHPRSSTLLLWVWWVGMGVAVSMLLWSCTVEFRRRAQEQDSVR